MRSTGSSAVASVVVAHQATAAFQAQPAVAQMLAEQAIDEAAQALLNSAAFTTETDIAVAMLEQVSADFEFDRLVESLVQDAARSAESVATTVRPRIGFVRYLSPPSCSRCAVLAGRVYRYSEGFLRHPNCFPAGTVVSGPGAHGASRRWYDGELVTIRTAGGKQFSVTGNHPVLTSQGWLPANLLREGGDVVSRASGDRSRALVVPDQDQMPARIEDLWRADGMRLLGRVPVAAEDFHGDGVGSSHVDVVLADGLLRNRQKVALLQQLREQLFAIRSVAAVSLQVASAGLQLGGRGSLALPDGMGGLGLSTALRSGHFAGSEQARFARMPDGDSGLDETPADDHSGHAGALSHGVLGLTRKVRSDDLLGVDSLSPTARWDAPAGEFSAESRGAYADRGVDLRTRLASQVEVDRIVECRSGQWSGHVFNLTSSEGWYDANGIIVSNCDCVMIPTTLANPAFVHDPVDLMRQGLVTDLSKADRKAINDGADFGKVVNVRLCKAGLRQSGRVLIRGGRPTPEAIYAQATSRDDAIEQLIAAGYVR